MSSSPETEITMSDTRPACVIDGVTDPAELEFHAVGGVTVTLCRRCYGRLIQVARAIPGQIWEPPDPLESIGQALIAEADLFAVLAQQRRRFGQMLVDRVRRDVPIDTSADEPSPTRK